MESGFSDLMRLLAVVAANFFVIVRVGTYMEKVAASRLSANHPAR
jgi:hypothetical protein